MKSVQRQIINLKQPNILAKTYIFYFLSKKNFKKIRRKKPLCPPYQFCAFADPPPLTFCRRSFGCDKCFCMWLLLSLLSLVACCFWTYMRAKPFWLIWVFSQVCRFSRSCRKLFDTQKFFCGSFVRTIIVQ